jgi:hypothetical protein
MRFRNFGEFEKGFRLQNREGLRRGVLRAEEGEGQEKAAQEVFQLSRYPGI